MFERDGVTYRFHHLGLPTREAGPGERYSAAYRMYTRDDPCRLARVQWHRYEPDSPLPALLKEQPHVAFQVDDLARAIAGRNVVLGPYEPIAGYRVAIVEDGGICVELVETDLTPEQVWAGADGRSALYRDDDAARRELRQGLAGVPGTDAG